MESLVSLIIPFIAISILSLMSEKITMVVEGIVNKIPKMPDHFDWWFAYLIVLVLSFLICWQGNFDLFVYLNIYFDQVWLGYLLTAAIISGGTTYVKSNFRLIESIPNVLQGVSAYVGRFATPRTPFKTRSELEKKDLIREEELKKVNSRHYDYEDDEESSSNNQTKSYDDRV